MRFVEILESEGGEAAPCLGAAGNTQRARDRMRRVLDKRGGRFAGNLGRVGRGNGDPQRGGSVVSLIRLVLAIIVIGNDADPVIAGREACRKLRGPRHRKRRIRRDERRREMGREERVLRIDRRIRRQEDARDADRRDTGAEVEDIVIDADALARLEGAIRQRQVADLEIRQSERCWRRGIGQERAQRLEGGTIWKEIEIPAEAGLDRIMHLLSDGLHVAVVLCLKRVALRPRNGRRIPASEGFGYIGRRNRRIGDKRERVRHLEDMLDALEDVFVCQPRLPDQPGRHAGEQILDIARKLVPRPARRQDVDMVHDLFRQQRVGIIEDQKLVDLGQKALVDGEIVDHGLEPGLAAKTRRLFQPTDRAFVDFERRQVIGFGFFEFLKVEIGPGHVDPLIRDLANRAIGEKPRPGIGEGKRGAARHGRGEYPADGHRPAQHHLDAVARVVGEIGIIDEILDGLLRIEHRLETRGRAKGGSKTRREGFAIVDREHL